MPEHRLARTRRAYELTWDQEHGLVLETQESCAPEQEHDERAQRQFIAACSERWAHVIDARIAEEVYRRSLALLQTEPDDPDYWAV